MVDLESKFQDIKAKWVSKILDSNETWSFLGKHYFNKFGPNDTILKMSFTSKKQFPYLDCIPRFYQDVITSFNKVKHTLNPTVMILF